MIELSAHTWYRGVGVIVGCMVCPASRFDHSCFIRSENSLWKGEGLIQRKTIGLTTFPHVLLSAKAHTSDAEYVTLGTSFS